MYHDESTRPWSRSALEQGGFRGFVPFSALAEADVPASAGVYTVVRATDEAPRFAESSTAGAVNGKDASVAVDVLEKKWVAEPEVLFIGKATPGTRKGLKERIEAYRRHGAGQKSVHTGGRYVWQLEDRDDLLVAWNVTHEDATVVETRMLGDFKSRYGALPFANLKG
jgi:hypothetical protein